MHPHDEEFEARWKEEYVLGKYWRMAKPYMGQESGDHQESGTTSEMGRPGIEQDTWEVLGLEPG